MLLLPSLIEFFFSVESSPQHDEDPDQPNADYIDDFDWQGPPADPSPPDMPMPEKYHHPHDELSRRSLEPKRLTLFRACEQGKRRTVASRNLSYC